MKSSNKLFATGFFLLLVFSIYFTYKILKVYHYFYSPLAYNFYTHTKDIKDRSLGVYYIDHNGEYTYDVNNGKVDGCYLDKDGVFFVSYQGSRQYHPVAICQYALDALNLIRQDKYYVSFIKQADWLVDNQVNGKWYYHFDYPQQDMYKPWVSAMAQGQGISVLIRAYELTHDSKYLKASEKAFDTLKIPVEQGGFVYKENASEYWYEEYPHIVNPSHVMNGHIWTLYGIWDLYRVTKNPDALDMFNKGSLALRNDLGKYDIGCWLVYDQESNFLINSGYMDFEIKQIEVMYAITGDPAYSQYAKKWRSYQHDKGNIVPIIFYALHCKLIRLFHSS